MNSCPAASEKAFSLVEVSLALGVFALLGLALIGLMGGALQSARHIQTDYQTTLLMENLSARYLLERDFPAAATNSTERLTCDENGEIVPEGEGMFELRLRSIQPPHWSGDHLEAMRVEILLHDETEVGSFVMQRARSGRGSGKP